MRMRKKNHGAERIEACAHLLITPTAEIKMNLQSAFTEERPIHLEIGCGKGNFAVGMAAQHHDVYFIAMEKIADVACLALETAEKAKDTRPDNLRFVIGDAKNLVEYFPAHSIDCIYLNFSDPWPKNRDREKRLTSCTFLEKYKQILAPGARICFKTDNRPLFDFSLQTFPASGFVLENVCFDLHNDPMNETNIETEYERKFSEKGFTINRLEAYLPL